MEAKTIGTFLLHLRKEKNLTQKDIAKLCSVSTQAVSKWERGESIPDIELLDRLSMLYSLTINEIIAGEKKETYIDIEKRSNIMTLTLSILVFITYFFTFAEIEVDLNVLAVDSIVVKGYQLVFDGINGWYVYLTWLVFILLISQLLLAIFIQTKIINRTVLNRHFQIWTSLIIALISLFNLFSKIFLPFPQFVILICSLMSLLLLYNNRSDDSFISKLSLYKKWKKESNLPKELELEENKLSNLDLRIIKTAMIAAIVFMIFYIVNLIMLTIDSFSEWADPELTHHYYIPLILVNLFVLVLMFQSFQFLKSVYVKKILLIYSILTLMVPLYLIIEAITTFFIISMIISFMIFSLPFIVLLFYVLKLNRVEKKM